MKLMDFLRASTKRERADVAVVCSGSTDYLYQLAGGHCFASPRKAILLEASTRKVAARTDGRLKPVPRATLVRYPDIFDPDAPFDVDLPE